MILELIVDWDFFFNIDKSIKIIFSLDLVLTQKLYLNIGSLVISHRFEAQEQDKFYTIFTFHYTLLKINIFFF